MRTAEVYVHNQLAGILRENEREFTFVYLPEYLCAEGAEAVSLTLPLSERVYQNRLLFPFFDGLIPEGWLLDIAEKNWKINHRDRMGLLLKTCHDCIGAVSILESKDNV